MYLACTDNVISEMQDATERRCCEMIASHERKRWQFRLFGRDSVRMEIIDEWKRFNAWMDNRIAFMRVADAIPATSRKTQGQNDAFLEGGKKA